MENIQMKVNDRTSVKPKFFCFKQNNSGGSFTVTDMLTHRVIVEAADEDEASRIGQNMGVYYNGCDEGNDCPCCGDRWHTPSEVNLQFGSFEENRALEVAACYKGEVVPTKYRVGSENKKDFVFENVEEYAQFIANEFGWCEPDVRIFYANGSVKEIYRQENRRLSF